ncbi:MAG TPA: lysylphosphatidylglycerol synthase transmembrane domain-containing protein [Vicinamibacterales bacterium]|nr:lysylphosphatidylglycerol synthase transmembrane domain-containing protein [Vicinamibacterales bacterium]
MRIPFRAITVVAAAVALLALFLRNVDLWRVGADIVRARPEWLLFSLATMPVNVAIRAYRWQYLLEPLGATSFGNAFRATVVGFAASSVLPARAGEVIRPYFLARQESHHHAMTATGAFATIILERVLDIITVLSLFASYVFIFGRDLRVENPAAFAWLQRIAAFGVAAAVGSFTILALLARDPERLRKLAERLARVVPSMATRLGAVVERFALGLGAVRRPARLFIALLWSLPLWLCIAAGIWAGAVAFDLAIPFTGTFPMIQLLAIGVAVPTPGGVGGFHAAFRYAATALFHAPDEAAVAAAIVVHLFTQVPVLLLGLVFAAQAGLNVGSMRRLASEPQPQSPA